MKKHELKILPEYFEEVVNRRKKFELRKNDRAFQVGDHILLREYIQDVDMYSGRSALVIIRYMIQDEQWLQPGVACLSIELMGTFRQTEVDMGIAE